MIARKIRFSAFFSASWLLIVFFIVPGISGFSQASKDKDKLQRTKQQLEEEIRFTTDLLEKTQKSKQTSLNKLQLLSKQIKSREALINAINRELNDVQVKISVESIQIDRMSKQLQGLKSEYARMIYYAYRTMNGYNKLMFIFSARDFNQAFQRLKYYQQYASYRRRQAGRIESTQTAINRERKELEDVKNQKLSLVESQQLEKQKLDREKTEKAKAVKEFSSKESQLLATLRTKQKAAQRLEYAIEKLIADEIRASEERLRKNGAGENKSPTSGKTTGTRSTMSLTPREKELSSFFSANRGRLPWPCDRGFVSGSFGEHAHPVLEYVKVKNNGIDIMTERGSLVKAVFNGRVSRVMSFPNLNKVVIIRHGEYLTVYSNLGEVSVRDGQEVNAKQNIGRVFTNPDDQKSELHFEIWRGKVIQNPEIWLAGQGR
ncbi:MAG: peptidoglycan DD-metalloendopeptidase family protein [Bacteroidota bacterium]